MTSVRDQCTQDPAVLRTAMVSALRGLDAIISDRVAAAFAAVPRHVFAVDEPLEEVYDTNTALVAKRGADGAALSSLSAAHIQAVMLEQAEIEPGMRVLEVGSGGCNAALIAELVGAEGSVTTVDIDQEIVARANAGLQASGYGQVRVVHADAEHGVPRYAPYDRIIVTVGAWDIPRRGSTSSPNKAESSFRYASPDSPAALRSIACWRDWSAIVTASAASCRCRATGRLLSSSCRSTVK
jgi:protein-L-isoaspartate(D-aspartate) O-methyltransferase